MATFFQDLLTSLNSQQGGQQSAQLKTPPTPPPATPTTPQSGGSNFFQQLLAKVSGAGQDIGKALTLDFPKAGYGTGKMAVGTPSAPENPISRFFESAAQGKVGPELPLFGGITSSLIKKVSPDFKSPTFKPAQLAAGVIGITPESLSNRDRYAKIQQTPTKDLSPKDLAFAKKYEEDQVMNMGMGFMGSMATEAKGVRGITRNLMGEALPWEDNAAAKVVKDSIPEAKAVAEKAKTAVETLPDIIEKEVTDVRNKVNIFDLFRTPDKVLKKIGLGDEATKLRAGYENYLKELPAEINKVTQWADRVKGERDASRRIFRVLDGQDTGTFTPQGKEVPLTPNEAKVAEEIKAYLKGWADRLGLPPEARITNYITHIFPRGLVEKEFDPDIAKIISESVAKTVYDPFVTKRLGKLGYKEDAWAALDAYVKRATRKVNLDPALEAISSASNKLENDSYQYVKSYIDNVNMRPNTVENWIDNAIKSTPIGYRFGQRPFNSLSKGIRQAIYRGTLGLNPISAMKNLTQGVNTYAKLGEKYTLIGYAKMLSKRFDPAEIAQSGILDKNLIEDRTMSAGKKLVQAGDKVLFSFFDTAEKMNRIPAYLGAKQMALDSGKSVAEAIEFAKQTVRDTQFAYGSIDTPVALQTDLGKTLLQFQSYSIKQLEFLTNMASNKEYAGLLRYTLASLLIANTVGKAIGMTASDFLPRVRVASSPLFALGNDVIGLITGVLGVGDRDQYGNLVSTQSRLKKLHSDVIPFVPGAVGIKQILKRIP